MPRLMGLNPADMTVGSIGGSGFSFSGKRIEDLANLTTEWTLVTIAVDETGSVVQFATQLYDCLKASVAGCKLSPRSDNIMIRVLYFGSQYQRGIEEVHGFKPLVEIDPNNYPPIVPQGMTTLNDACFSGVGAIHSYGADLRKQEYNANGILFVISDGAENASTATQDMVKKELESIIADEQLESMISVLIGINAAQYKNVMEKYQKDTGINFFIDAGDATPENLAKLGQFVSKSVSSQSQAIGTGGPSQTIPTTI